MTKEDLSVIYYTSNFLETENPVFLANTKKQLVKAIGDLPLIVVSLTPVAKESFEGYEGYYRNIVAGRDFEPYRPGRHHLNIYYQIMIGARNATTRYVAMAEDDILYSYDHFHSREIPIMFQKHGDIFLFDMNKVSLFTWTKPPMFSFRSKRRVVNQLIAPTLMLYDAMMERFGRLEYLLKHGKSEEWILHYWGDPGRYESTLGVKVRKSEEYYSNTPSIVFTHPKAYGYLNHGTRKKLGDIRIIELADWGRAERILKLWGDKPLT
jgi:hypothetical protein